MKIALFAAFPQELKQVRKNFRSLKKTGERPFPLFIAKQRGCEMVAVQTGMNTGNIETAFRFIREKHRPDLVLSLGFCGALYNEARIGDLVWASQYFNLSKEEMKLPYGHAAMAGIPADAGGGEILERLQGQIRIQEASFVTLSAWMPKSRLIRSIPQEIPFPVCDRETFYLAQWSQQNQLPFFAIRSVTDRSHEDIPSELYQVADETGHYSFFRALGILFARPSLIFESVKLGRHAARASRSLAQAVNALVDILSAPETSARQRP
jgi:nucleoside phosphorylase